MNKKFINIARSLRKNSTDAEKYLWNHIRRRQLEGFKFRRQETIGRYIVDFINFERKIVIELDGGQHSIQRKKDEERDKLLKDQGYKVLRFWNNDVLKNIEGVLETVSLSLREKFPSPNGRGKG